MAFLSTLSTLKYIYLSVFIIFQFRYQLMCRLYFRTDGHIFPENPMNYVVFPCLTCFILIFGIVSLMAKQSEMDICKQFSEISPERSYSVSEAARFLGIHRCTIYDYITHTERPLPFFRMQDNLRIQFRGDDLIAYKTAGLPKKGRKRR